MAHSFIASRQEAPNSSYLTFNLENKKEKKLRGTTKKKTGLF